MDDLISRKAVIDALHTWFRDGFDEDMWWNSTHVLAAIEGLPSAQPQYEELTPEEAASEIASGSIMSAQYWLDAMVRLKQMGYVICKTTM